MPIEKATRGSECRRQGIVKTELELPLVERGRLAFRVWRLAFRVWSLEFGVLAFGQRWI